MTPVPGLPRKAVPFISILFVMVTLGGCRTVGDLVAAAAGGASAGATANPAVGIAVGIGVQAGIDATVSYIVRKRQQAEQDAIANEVATMQPGEQRPWKIRHDIPIGNEHGVVTVTRAITTPLALCKELVFSVETGHAPDIHREWYKTEACRGSEQWKWSLAEPAVERWGSLQ